MQDSHFDQITRSYASSPSRRRLLGGLTGAVAASFAAFGEKGSQADAAPNACSVGCASLQGPRKAACKQACKDCGGDFDALCIDYGPFGPVSIVCCQDGTYCAGDGTCCAVGIESCTGSGGTVCCDPATFCDGDGNCLPYSTCDTCVFDECDYSATICARQPSGDGFCVCVGIAGECHCLATDCGDYCDPEAQDCGEGRMCNPASCCGGSRCESIC
jgi:hypothetical protein